VLDKTPSDETRAKMSASQPNSQKIEVTDLDSDITTSYNSIHEAAKDLNIRFTAISNYILRNQTKPYKGRYTFKKL
jgi:NUMOD1 domain